MLVSEEQKVLDHKNSKVHFVAISRPFFIRDLK